MRQATGWRGTRSVPDTPSDAAQSQTLHSPAGSLVSVLADHAIKGAQDVDSTSLRGCEGVEGELDERVDGAVLVLGGGVQVLDVSATP